MSTPMEICSALVERFIAGGAGCAGDVDCTTTSSEAATSLADPLVSRMSNVPGREARALEDVYNYAFREIDVVKQFMVVLRTTVEDLMQILIAADMQQQHGPQHAAPSAGGATDLNGPPSADFLQLGHRSERLELLGRRMHVHFLDALVPPTREVEEMSAALAKEVRDHGNPFAFPSEARDEGDAPRRPSAAAPLALLPPTDGPRDIDLVSESVLFRLFRALTSVACNTQDTLSKAIETFQETKIGAEGAVFGLEGLAFHGQMQEVRQLWKRLVIVLREFGVLGRILRSAMASQRSQRQWRIMLLESGAMDDLRPEIDDASADACVLPQSLMRTATTRLQMRRLAMLVATSRALDASGADAAMKKIRFEQERRQSAVEASSASAGTQRRSNAPLPPLHAPMANKCRKEEQQQVTTETSPRSSSPSAVAASDVDADPFANIEPLGMGRRQSRVSSSTTVPPIQSMSVVPPTTLMDLEMIVRAYGLHIPCCTLPPAEMLSRRTEESETVGDAGLDITRQLIQKRQERLREKSARLRDTMGDPEELMHHRRLYASNLCETGVITTDCVVMQRADHAAQTAFSGIVYEGATMDDVLGELTEARSALKERTQQLMLERQRSHALLSQLERLQRQRQDHARRSAAAGSGTLGDDVVHDGQGSAEAAVSPPRCVSPVLSASYQDDGGAATQSESSMVMESAVGTLLQRHREQQELRRVPSATLEKRSSGSPLYGSSPNAARAQPASSSASSAAARCGATSQEIVITQLTSKADKRPLSLGGRSPNSSPTPQVPTAGHHLNSNASIAPHDVSLEATLPQRAELHPSPTKRPVSAATLDRQFGPIFARKLRSLEHHANSLVDTVREEDYWSGKREIKSVVVPGGIDPRHGTRLVAHKGETSVGTLVPPHTMTLLQGPSAAALSRFIIGPAELRATHYGTVGVGSSAAGRKKGEQGRGGYQ